MKEIYDYLRTVGAVTDIFGSSHEDKADETRIYPLTAPDGVDMPYAVYFIVSKGSGYQYTGRMDTQRYIVQVSVYGKKYHGSGQVRSGADAIIQAMDNLHSADNKQGLEASFQEEERLIREEEKGYFHIPLTFAVWK